MLELDSGFQEGWLCCNSAADVICQCLCNQAVAKQLAARGFRRAFVVSGGFGGTVFNHIYQAVIARPGLLDGHAASLVPSKQPLHCCITSCVDKMGSTLGAAMQNS